MKHLEERIVEKIQSGFCAPQVASLAKALKEPGTTVHYNTKKMESEGKILAYKAVFDYSKINRGYCSYVLITIPPDTCKDPSGVAGKIAAHTCVESVDIITGDWELIIKVRTRDTTEFYEFLKDVLAGPGITKTKSLTVLKQVKSEHVYVTP